MRSFGEFWRIIHEPEENPERYDVYGYPLWRLFYRYYLRPHKPSMALIFVLGCALGLVMYGYAYAGRFIADEIIEMALIERPSSFDPSMPGEYQRFSIPDGHARSSWVTRLDARSGRSIDEKAKLLGMVAIALVLMELARHAASGLVLERTVYLTQKAQFQLRQQIHDKLHALPLQYHDRHSPGRLMTHLFSDMSAVQMILTTLMRQIPPNILAIVVGAVLIMVLNATIGVLVLIALPAYVVCHHWIRGRLKRVNRNLREREGKLNAHIANRVGHFHLVKSYGRESGEAVDFLKQAKPILHRNLASTLLGSVFAIACGLISGTCTTMVLWVGTLSVRNGSMTPGELLMFFAAAGYMFSPVSILTTQAGQLYRVRAVAAKVMRVLDEPITLVDPQVPAALPADACEIRFENVSLNYNDDPHTAIDRVSFTLPAGKRVCVMGPSAAGKTTLAKLCARLYDPTTGRILFDGIDLKEFKITELRKYMGFVCQEPIVFSGTIADNIRYGATSAGERQIIAAAQYAQIHDFIEKLPERYRTLTQERGLTLSGGQKQRVNLARALISDAKVLILDDCTSALDADTEAKLVDGFRTALDGRTCVLVSHRVSMAMVSDYVLMMEDGQVVEFGSPQQLIQDGGRFAEVVNQQEEKIRLVEAQTDHAELAEVQQ
jgi:ATP-binding cassette subfamily B protein